VGIYEEGELVYNAHMRDEFLTKARENLKAAEVLFEQQLYNAAVNRAYYAAFQAAIAALADQGIATERWGHAAIQANFATELIQRRKRYPGHFRAYLMDLQSTLDDADYKLKFVSSRVARRQLTKAKEFVDAIVMELAP
jgi:uncharacterized protein (UPF0332 family)